MKKLTKILSVIAILAILVVSLSVFASCDKPAATEDSSFELVIRKYNGQDDNFNAKLDGDILAQKTVEIKAGQVRVSEALTQIATKDGDTFKIAFNDTDYILYTQYYDTWGNVSSWMITDGNFAAVPEYVAEDFGYSYCAYNGHYSNGVYMDFVDGLKVYTVVVDGWDGEIGTTKSYA